MTTILHILTQSEDALAPGIIAAQTRLPECAVETVDLTQPKPDYEALVEKIFRADSVAVW